MLKTIELALRSLKVFYLFFFFFQAEDGIRDKLVTGVQTCALPICDYYFCDGQPLGERNPKWLQDDYVKFLRWGQWRIEKTGQGVLAFITNHGYLDNPTFRGMRQNLMQTFDEIYLLDLHGNSKKKETVPNSGAADKNVFDIQQGVAIGIFVKLPPGAKSKAGSPLPAAERRARSDAPGQQPPATVRHCHLWGAERQTKYDWLD